MNLAYIGLSHLSLCYSASSLVHSHKVKIFDEKKVTENYLLNKINIYEPNLKKIQKKYKDNLSFSYNFNELINFDIIFIAVDIKTDHRNKVDYKRINNLIKKLQKIKELSKPVVLMSQVEVGFTRKLNYPKNLLFHYVETLVFGIAIQRALEPERIIIGKSSNIIKFPRAVKKYLSNFNCEVIEMKYEESELTKAFINIYLASQLITTNNLTQISRTYNCDWEIIKRALKKDKRIGIYSYLQPGLGISGGNIERDIKTLSDCADSNHLRNNFFKVLSSDSSYFKDWLFRNIKEKINLKDKVGILGISYKEDSFSIKNAPSLYLIKNAKKYKFLLHDFNFNHLDISIEFKQLYSEENEILKNVNCIVLLHNNENYKKLNYRRKNLKLILDPFKFLDKKKLNKSTIYVTL